MTRLVLFVAACLAPLAFAVAGTPKESDFPDEFTVVESGAYPNNVCWLVLRLGDSLYRVRDTSYFSFAATLSKLDKGMLDIFVRPS